MADDMPPTPPADALRPEYDGSDVHPAVRFKEQRRAELPEVYTVLANHIKEMPSLLLEVEDQYNPRRSKYNPHALVRAHLYRLSVPIIDSFHDLESHLHAYPHIAEKLGFENIPSDDTLRRAWQERFPEVVRHHIETYADHLLNEVIEWANVPVDDVVSNRGGETAEEGAPDPENISLADKQAAIANIKPLMYDVLDFERAHNAHYDINDLLDLQAEISRENEFLQKVVDDYREEDGDVPAARSYFNAIENRSAEEWRDRFREVYDRQLTAANGAGLFDEPVPVYIDGTVIPFFKQNGGLPAGVLGGAEKRGTYYGYHYITITAHDGDRSVVLASYPLEEDDGLKEAVQYCIRQAERFVDISDVAMDSEFRKAETIAWLQDRGHDVTLQYPKHGKRIKRKLARMEGKFDFTDYTIRSSSTNTHVQMTLLGEPNYDNVDSDFTFERSQSEGGQLGLEEWGAGDDLDSLSLDEVDDRLWKGRRSFVTTKEIEDVDDVKQVLADYKYRWRIETNFRVIKDEFLAKTTSRKFNVRTFYWLYAVMLYNSWVLLDVFLRQDFPEAAPDDRPVMTARSFAKRFLQTAYQSAD